MMGDLFNGGSLPVLERLLQFTERRHRVLVDDIANLSTPYYKPRDLSPASFQQTLRDAIDRRRAGGDPASGPLEMQDTPDLRFSATGIAASPRNTNDNILFHDQNNRDVERIMQRLAENQLAHKTGIELMRSEIATLQAAIRERV